MVVALIALAISLTGNAVALQGSKQPARSSAAPANASLSAGLLGRKLPMAFSRMPEVAYSRFFEGMEASRSYQSFASRLGRAFKKLNDQARANFLFGTGRGEIPGSGVLTAALGQFGGSMFKSMQNTGTGIGAMGGLMGPAFGAMPQSGYGTFFENMNMSLIEQKHLGQNAVGTSNIAPDAITQAKIAANAVTPSGVSFPSAEAKHTVEQTMPAAFQTAGLLGAPIKFNSESFDTDAFHDHLTVSQQEFLTAPVAGVYTVSARVVWEADPDGFRQLNLFKNGSPIEFTSTPPAFNENGSAKDTMQELSAEVKLVAGDKLELRGMQYSAPCTGSPPACLSQTLKIRSNPKFNMTWHSKG